MHKVLSIVCSLILCAQSSFARQTINVPDQFVVEQHWVSVATSFAIESEKTILGNLYRRFFSLQIVYELFDDNFNRLALTKGVFFNETAHFEVFEKNGVFIGYIREPMFVFFPSFEVFGKNRRIRLAKAVMNFWGTTFTILDPATEREMAKMTRPFVRNNNNWTVTITNRTLFDRRAFDSNVLITAIAMQGDREYWETQRFNENIRRNENDEFVDLTENTVDLDDTRRFNEISRDQVLDLLKQIRLISVQMGIRTINNPDPVVLERVANDLEADYVRTIAPDDITQTNFERFRGFTNYCLNLIQLETVPQSRKRVILYLLNLRLEADLI